LAVCKELLGKGFRDLIPYSRALGLLLVVAEDVADQAEDLAKEALLDCWGWSGNYPLLLVADCVVGIVAVGLDCAGSRQTGDESVANIHYVCLCLCEGSDLIRRESCRIRRGG
jgi:hypothetical protein